MPLTLRLVFHSIRATWLAVIIALVGWMALTPATPAEQDALGPMADQDRLDGLVPMRVARVLVYFAPDRAAQMLSNASDGTISVELAGMLLRDLASGSTFQNMPANGDVTTDTTNPRSTTGAKFVQVD